MADEVLVQHFRAGERNAFDELVRRHHKGLFNFVLRSVRRRDLAEELVQDTWLRIVQNVAGFQQAAKFSTWAYTVARNLCIDHARKAVLRRHPSLDQPSGASSEGPLLGDSVKDQGAEPDRAALGRQLQEHLAEAIGALPEDQREVFVLREYSDLPFREIAAIVGAPENTVKSRMRYALERLQEALAEYEEYSRAIG